MDASNGLRALALAVLAVIVVACTDPGPDAGSTAGPSAAPAAGSQAPGPGTEESAVPSVPSGPDDYGY